MSQIKPNPRRPYTIFRDACGFASRIMFCEESTVCVLEAGHMTNERKINTLVQELNDGFEALTKEKSID